MRLVIDPQHIEQITLVVGSVELPITREQLMELLSTQPNGPAPSHRPAQLGPAPLTNGHVPRRPRSVSQKVADREVRFSQGLCSKCDKKRLSNSKLCRRHYDVIIKNQKKARKA